jgi:hypothetical protein
VQLVGEKSMLDRKVKMLETQLTKVLKDCDKKDSVSGRKLEACQEVWP